MDINKLLLRDDVPTDIKELLKSLYPAENKLRESESRFKVLHQASFGGIAIHDKGLVIECNQGLADMSGHTVEELIGCDGLKLLVAPDWQDFVKEKILSGYENIYEAEGIRKDGSLYALEVQGKNIPYQGRQVRVTEFRDITERKQAEKALQQAQKMESIGTLSAGIAHDFNNILVGLQGYTEIASMEAKNEKISSYLLEIKKCSDRATNLVKQILNFSRISDEEKNACDAKQVVEECIDILHSLIPSSIEIIADHRADTTEIECDPTQIYQVLMNIGTNAFHAMIGQDSGILEINTSNFLANGDEFDIPAGNYFSISLKDNGVGMDPETMGKIFNPFYTTKASDRGTGLGLSVSKGIVKSHNGAILVNSVEGQGTTFRILLPVTKEKIQKTVSEKTVIPSGNEKILLVDDEEIITNLYSTFMERQGYQVEIAKDGHEAFNKYSQEKYDLIITDQTMPGMTGLVLAKKLKENGNKTPIILCTGLGDIVASKEIEELGIVAKLSKPCELATLGATSRNVLDKHKQRS